jgi:hypothetical protein
MTLDRAEIYRRLSPNTLQEQWLRAQYAATSWRVQTLKFAVILIACSLQPEAISAVILFGTGLGFMRLYFIKPDEKHFQTFKMHKYGFNEIMSINRQVMQTILRTERSTSIRDRGILILIQLGRLRPIDDTLKQGPLSMLQERDPDEVYHRTQIILDSGQVFLDMSADMHWIQTVESQLKKFHEQYVSLLRALCALSFETGMKQLNITVNDYATFVLNAMEHPFEPLKHVA